MKRTKTESKKLAGRYLLAGMANTAIVYAVYEALALTVCRTGENLPVASIISGVAGTITGCFIHSRWTWQSRTMNRRKIGRYFIWNAGLALGIKPALTWFFELFGFLYKFAFEIFQALHIPFSQEFVQTTGIFVLMEVVIMVLNFLVYDSFVFGTARKEKRQNDREEIEVESVGEASKEVERERKAK